MTALTLEEAAERLQVCTATYTRWLKKGAAPGRKIGRAWKVHPADLDAFVRGQWTPIAAGSGPEAGGDA